MATTAEAAAPELTPDESRSFLEEQTRKYLGLSLDEFYRRADEGTLPDHPVVTHLVLLSGARPGPC